MPRPTRTTRLPLSDYLNTLDVEKLREEYASAAPTHFVCMDDFLRPDFAEAVSRAYPSYAQALEMGELVAWRLNEKVKVQVCDSKRFPEPVAALHSLFSSQEFLDVVERITGIPRLLADPGLAGAGMHVMGDAGRLDAHVDFNILPVYEWHRRLNILIYLTPGWRDDWGGAFELYHPDLRKREAAMSPRFNRCVMFNTTDTSFHRVTPISAPAAVTRNSFAAYYYTEEAPPGWKGKVHGTIYRALPGEWWKGYVRMPAERVTIPIMSYGRRAIGKIRRVLG